MIEVYWFNSEINIGLIYYKVDRYTFSSWNHNREWIIFSRLDNDYKKIFEIEDK